MMLTLLFPFAWLLFVTCFVTLDTPFLPITVLFKKLPDYFIINAKFIIRVSIWSFLGAIVFLLEKTIEAQKQFFVNLYSF